MNQQEQIQTLIAQNAELLEQNRQIMAMLQQRQAVPISAPVISAQRKPTRKEKKTVSLMKYHYNILAKINPELLPLHKSTLQKRGLWQD